MPEQNNAAYILSKWAGRKAWDEPTQKRLLCAFIEELGEEGPALLDRFLAAAGEQSPLAEWVEEEQRLGEWFAPKPD
jgi:hypothetical protein